MAGSKGTGILKLDRGLTNVHSHQQPTIMLISPHLWRHRVLSNFLIFDNGMAEKNESSFFTGRLNPNRHSFHIHLLPILSVYFSLDGLSFLLK